MSIDNATPEEWDRARMKATQKQIGGSHYKDKGSHSLYRTRIRNGLWC